MSSPRLRGGRGASVVGASSRHREEAPGSAAVTVLLVTGFVLGAVLTLVLVRGGWTETPFEAGSWALELDVTPGAEAVREQIRGMQRIAGATAAQVSLLSLVSLVGVLRQRSRLRRTADRIHWAVGASRRDFAARWIGEGWRSGLVAGTVSLGAGLALPVALAGTFPGASQAPPTVFWTCLLLVLLGVGLLHRARGAGIRAAWGREGGLGRLLSLPGVVAAPAFATLVLAGLLRADAGGPGGPLAPGPESTMAVVGLEAVGPERRGPVLEGWFRRIGGTVGMASPGTLRGTGREGRVWVDCGRCSVGGLPLPVQAVQAELHAVAPDTFAHLDMEILQGRDFRPSEAGDGITAAIVSRALALRHFEGGQAVGRRIRFGDRDWIEVVGVVEDRWDVRDPDEFALYLPVFQLRPDVVEVIGEEAGTLSTALSALPPGARISSPRPVSELFASIRWFERLLTLLAMGALTVAVAGIWLGARAEMRARIGELALRRALGARPRHLLRYWVGFVTRHFGGALAAGAWLAVALAAELERHFGMPPVLDLRVWTGAALPLFAAFLVGALPPFLTARQAAPATRLEGES